MRLLRRANRSFLHHRPGHHDSQEHDRGLAAGTADNQLLLTRRSNHRRFGHDSTHQCSDNDERLQLLHCNYLLACPDDDKPGYDELSDDVDTHFDLDYHHDEHNRGRENPFRVVG